MSRCRERTRNWSRNSAGRDRRGGLVSRSAGRRIASRLRTRAAFRQRRRKLPDQPLRVERGDKDRARAAHRQFGYRARRDGRAARRRFGRHPGHRPLRLAIRPKPKISPNPRSRAVRIDNRDRTAFCQRSDQRARRGRRMRVRQRLVQRVAAANVVEGLDAQSHSGTLHRDAAARSTGSVIRLKAARSGQPQQRFRDRA